MPNPQPGILTRICFFILLLQGKTKSQEQAKMTDIFLSHREEERKEEKKQNSQEEEQKLLAKRILPLALKP